MILSRIHEYNLLYSPGSFLCGTIRSSIPRPSAYFNGTLLALNGTFCALERDPRCTETGPQPYNFLRIHVIVSRTIRPHGLSRPHLHNPLRDPSPLLLSLLAILWVKFPSSHLTNGGVALYPLLSVPPTYLYVGERLMPPDGETSVGVRRIRPEVHLRVNQERKKMARDNVFLGSNPVGSTRPCQRSKILDQEHLELTNRIVTTKSIVP